MVQDARWHSLIEVLEALLPVGGTGHAAILVQQLDAKEVQHEGVGLQEVAAGLPGVLEFLPGSSDRLTAVTCMTEAPPTPLYQG